MAGVTMRLFNKTALDYPTLGAAYTQMLVVANAINVTNYREGTLAVRVHGTKTIDNNAVIKVVLVRTAPTEEDPGVLFYVSDPALVTVTIDTATTAPPGAAGILLTAALPDNFGGFLGLVIMGVQDAASSTCKATISVDLTLKE